MVKVLTHRGLCVVLALALYAGGAPLAAAPEAAPSPPPPPVTVRPRDARLEMARLLLRDGNFAEALEAYEEVLKQAPEDPDALRGSIEALTALKRGGEARVRLERLLSDPKRAKHSDWLRRARLHVEIGQKNEALAVMTRLEGVKPSDPDEAMAHAEVEVLVGRPIQARRRFDALPANVRASQAGRELEAAIERAMGRPRRAVEILQELVKARPGDPRLRRDLADAMSAAGQDAASLKLRLGALKPDSPRDDVVGAARTALDVGDVGTARRLVARLTGAPATLDEALVRADVAVRSRQARQAIALLEQARGRFGSSPEIRRALAGALLAAGRPEDVVSMFERSASSRPAAERVLLLRAYLLLGRWPPARRLAGELRRARLEPTEMLDLGDAWLDLFEAKEALALARAWRPDPASPTGASPADSARRAVLEARALAALGEPDDTVLAPLKAYRTTRDPDVALAVAHVLYLTRREQDALDTLARAGKSTDPRIEFLRALLQYKLTWRRDPLIAVAEKYANDPEALGPIHEELVEALSEAELPNRALELLRKSSAGGPPPAARAVLEARIRYLQLGEVTNAIRIVDELIASAPGAVPPARRLAAAELLANVGEAERAWAALEIADLPTGLRMRRLVLTTRLYLREPEDAAADRREAVRLLTEARPQGVEEKLDLAEALLEVPDPARALALATSVDSHRGRFRAAVIEARVLIPRNQIAPADDRLHELAHFPARTPAETATLVGLELGRRRTPGARALAGTLPDWWVKTHEGRKLRMNFVLLADDRATAVQLARQMSAERPTDADVEGLAAQALVADRGFKRALTAYDQLLKRRPQDEGFRIGRAQVLRKINRARDAYAAMRALAQEYRARGEPVPASLELVIAGIVEDLHDYLRVRATMEWALELFPGDPELLKGLARAHARMDKPALALELFEEAQAAEEQPRPVENLQTISGYLRSLGSRGEAVHALEHALEIEPENPDALTAMAGLMSERDRTRKRGLELYKRAVDRDPANPDLRAARASALLAAGRHRQADRELDRVHSSRPRHPGAQRVRADLELAHGHTLRAERALVRLKKEAGPDPSVDIGLSRVAEARGKGYLTERVVHALRAYDEAPRREEVHQRLDQVVRTRYSLRHEYETDTNDLTNRFVRGELFQVMGPAFEAAVRSDLRTIVRRNVRVEGVDLHLDGSLNPERGTSFDGTLTLGMLGDNNVDLLGAVEVGHRTPNDWSFSYRVSRARIDDSPDALLRTIRATAHLLETERQVGPWVFSAFHRIEHFNDGNERTTTSPRLGYRFHPRLAISLEYLHASSLFQPDPIDLYFAPLSYDLTVLDIDWQLKPAAEWTITVGGGPRREEQAGQGANGVQGRFRAAYRFRQELEAFIGGAVQYSEGNRRLAVVEPYTLTGLQFGINGRF